MLVGWCRSTTHAGSALWLFTECSALFGCRVLRGRLACVALQVTDRAASACCTSGGGLHRLGGDVTAYPQGVKPELTTNLVSEDLSFFFLSNIPVYKQKKCHKVPAINLENSKSEGFAHQSLIHSKSDIFVPEALPPSLVVKGNAKF